MAVLLPSECGHASCTCAGRAYALFRIEALSLARAIRASRVRGGAWLGLGLLVLGLGLGFGLGLGRG
eukprot:scaffold66561_cov46-Phaeocystis_antarctica.AAC.1